MTKRIVDICGAALGLLVTAPLLAVAALAIKLDSGGPVLQTQMRVGQGGRLFRLYRLRWTAAAGDATGEPGSSLTRVGTIVRLLRLDALPQLVNVLKGDMSLVGPSPETPAAVACYTPEQREVLAVRPGITGPAQIVRLGAAFGVTPGGGPEPSDARPTAQPTLQSELRYVRTRSLGLDLRYLLQTQLEIGHQVLSRPRLSRPLKVIRVVADCGAVAAATYFAFIARFDGALPAPFGAILLWGLPLTLASFVVAFAWMATYRGIWRYAGIEDMWQVVRACAVGGVINAAAMHVLAVPYPRTTLVLTPIFTIFLMAGARTAVRTGVTLLARARPVLDSRRIVIIGAGRTGEAIAREILSRPGLGYEVVGFVDDERRLARARIHNLPVLGTTEQLPQLAETHGLSEAIIAISRLGLGQLQRIGQACTRAGLEFKTLPSVGQLVRGDGRLRYLRSVKTEDLLPRDTASLDPERIRAFLEGKRVMVTGAGGSIGSELCRQIARLGAEELLMVERAENALFDIATELQANPGPVRVTAALADIKHIPRMSELFHHFKPDVIFHAAAYKHVPILESHPTEAVLNNVIGTVRLAELARVHGTEKFVFISTDKAVKPGNLMGSSKRICELYLIALNGRLKAQQGGGEARPDIRVVRFGNVLGSAGSALPLFQSQIENGAPITITDLEVSRFFMTVREAVALVLESASMEIAGDITVLDMGEPVKIAKLADDLVAAMGLPPSAVSKRVVGLRPGEKMHEALWEDVDEVRRCAHPRVMAVRQRGADFAVLQEAVVAMERMAIAGDVPGLLEKVHELVPTYVPGHPEAAPPVVTVARESPERVSHAVVNGAVGLPPAPLAARSPAQ